MDNPQNFEILAKSAIGSKNYQQAFDYYSKLLEYDATKSQYWVGKGIASGWLSTPESPRFEELVSCIITAGEFKSISNDEKLTISEEVINIAESKIKDTLYHIDKEVTKEFDLKPMGTGTLYSVHQTAKLSIQLSIGNKYSPTLIKAIDAVQFAYKLESTEKSLNALIKQIDLIFQHSANNVNYFKTHKEAGNRFEQMQQVRTDAATKLKEINPNAEVPASPSGSNSGCFIATAAAGDINHPSVIQLRYFRDSYLMRYSFGQKFIAKYYKHSPPIANKIRDNGFLKRATYYLLVKPLSHFTRILTK